MNNDGLGLIIGIGLVLLILISIGLVCLVEQVVTIFGSGL